MKRSISTAEVPPGRSPNELVRKHVLKYLKERLRLYLSYLGERERPALRALRDPRKVEELADLVMRELGYQVGKST